MIATRTREGLAALKARGVTKTGKPVRLGNPLNGSPSQQAVAAGGIRRKADAYAAGVMIEIEKLQRHGITSLEALAEMLTGRVKTPRGKDVWRPLQVKRILERMGPADVREAA